MANYAIKANPAIRKPGPVTPKDVKDIEQCFAEGLGVRDTARKLGLSGNQVTAAKAKHGLVSLPPENHAQQVAGAEAFATKARRNRLARYERLAEIDELTSGKLIAALKGDKQWSTVLRGVQGIEGMELVDEVPSRDLREVTTAIVQIHLSMGKIEDKEEDGGQARALSVLEKFNEQADKLVGALPAPREGLIQE